MVVEKGGQTLGAEQVLGLIVARGRCGRVIVVIMQAAGFYSVPIGVMVVTTYTHSHGHSSTNGGNVLSKCIN